MIGRRTVLLIAAIALAPAGAAAQSASGAAGSSIAAIGPSAPMPTVKARHGGRFERLSRGSQEIALAFYYAQDIERGGPGLWSLDDIAADRLAGRAWSDVYARMHRAGAIAGVTLDEIMRRSADASRERLAGTAPAAELGAFQGLTPADRRVAEALLDDQTIGPQGRQAWSLDQIATARRQGAPWTDILARMRADGLIRETSLRRIVASAERRDLAFPTVVSGR